MIKEKQALPFGHDGTGGEDGSGFLSLSARSPHSNKIGVYPTMKDRDSFWRFETMYELNSPAATKDPVPREEYLGFGVQFYRAPAIRPDEFMWKLEYPCKESEESEMKEMVFQNQKEREEWLCDVLRLLQSFPDGLRQLLSKDVFPPGWTEYSREHQVLMKSFHEEFWNFVYRFNHRVPRRLYIIHYYIVKVGRTSPDGGNTWVDHICLPLKNRHQC